MEKKSGEKPQPSRKELEYTEKKEAIVLKITIDATRCIGCGMCAAAAPEVFRLEGRVSTVLCQPQQSWAAFDAANGCPVNAIVIQK